jgi:hypothetical protein
MSPTNWNTAVFNSELNDGIVPVASQLNDTSEISGLFAFPGVIHSPGIEALGFSGPSDSIQPVGYQTLSLIYSTNRRMELHFNTESNLAMLKKAIASE